MGMKNIGTAAAIFDDQGRILMVKHNYDLLNWELPGGGCEANESIAQTAVRETLEETGLSVTPVRLSGMYYEAERDIHGFVFICELIDSDKTPRPIHCHLELSREISECGWFLTDNLPHPITDFTIRRIQDACKDEVAWMMVDVEKRRLVPERTIST